MMLNGSVVVITDFRGEKYYYSIHPDYKGNLIELAKETYIKEFSTDKHIASIEIEKNAKVNQI